VTEATAGASLYLHVPFCARRCHYCDFNTYAGLDELIPRYVEALLADLRAVARAGPRGVAPPRAEVGPEWPVFGTVFVGGGTPTLLPVPELVRVLACVREVLPVAEDAEVTVEANPETVDVAYFGALVAAGVDRVSMGAQSFAPHVLAALGRWHDPDRPLRAVADARSAGVERISLDLIYGTPAETDADWAGSLRGRRSTRAPTTCRPTRSPWSRTPSTQPASGPARRRPPTTTSRQRGWRWPTRP
jgi:oxygen-independent coproporphyrinogen-3 oxidase